MADKFIIKDTILLTAGLKNLRTGKEYFPAILPTVSVFKKSGECLLDKEDAEKVVIGEGDEEVDYNYLYEWTIEGTELSPLVEASDLIVVWDWSGTSKPQKKRLTFKVIPEV